MINKGKRKNNRVSKFITQSKEQKYYTKYKIDTNKIVLSELSEKEFINKVNEYYFEELIFRQYFQTGNLFSINKNSSYKEITKINLLLEELKLNNVDSPRVIFFQSPPMIGMSYIIRYFNKNNFKFFLFQNTFGNDNKSIYKKYFNNDEFYNTNDFKDGSILPEYQKLFDIMEEKYDNENNNTYFIILKNLPYELFLMALKDNSFSPNFIKNWKSTLLLFFEKIIQLLDKDYTKIKLLFITDDKEIDEYELKTIFPNKIIEHNLTKNIICNPISSRKMNEILRKFLNIFIPQIVDDNNIRNFIESIYLEFNSNIQQILDYIILKVVSEYYLKLKYKKLSQVSNNFKSLSQKGIKRSKEFSQKLNKVNKISKNDDNKNFQIQKEKLLDHDLFRLLGKLLYNKRYVTKNNSIQKLKKEEFGSNLETPRYYDLNEFINDIPISNNSFNDLLIYNSIEHFNDISEYSETFELYSFTDTIDNFNSYIYDKNYHFFHSNNYMKTYLNCFGLTTYNLSQYNTDKKFNPFLCDKGLMNIHKPKIKVNNNLNKFNEKLYYKSCEHYPCLISINLFNFYKEGIYDIYKIYYNEDNKNRTLKSNTINDIKSYYKEKVNQKFLKENEDDNFNININNKSHNNSPKSKKFRNIPEEDKNALEKIFNDNDESETDSIIEE
jgi:hypothetical protein